MKISVTDTFFVLIRTQMHHDTCCLFTRPGVIKLRSGGGGGTTLPTKEPIRKCTL